MRGDFEEFWRTITPFESLGFENVKVVAKAAWDCRKAKDAMICRDVDPPLSSDAAPNCFATAIEGSD